jgi:hypothetical protein
MPLRAEGGALPAQFRSRPKIGFRPTKISWLPGNDDHGPAKKDRYLADLAVAAWSRTVQLVQGMGATEIAKALGLGAPATGLCALATAGNHCSEFRNIENNQQYVLLIRGRRHQFG